MKTEEAVQELKSYIEASYAKTMEPLAPGIVRGHLRSISTDIEDGIALFVSHVLPEGYKLLLDPSIHVDGVNNRPDLLVVDESNAVKAMIEIKANMGWCRNASGVLDDIVSNDAKFKSQGRLSCEFSKEETIEVFYEEGVKLFLVALTDSNCTEKKHIANKAYADSVGVHQYNLFSGWYGGLTPLEVETFAAELLK